MRDERRVAITQYIVPHDDDFNKYRKPTTIIVNDINGLLDVTAAEEVNSQIYTIYKKNFVDVVPSCICGKLNTRFHLNKTCPKCNSVCKNEDGSTPVMWIRAHPGMPFLNTAYWGMIRFIVDKKVDVLRYLSDTNYNPIKKPEYVHSLVSVIGGKRGYKNLINNFEKVLIYLKSIPKFKAKQKTIELIDLFIWIWNNKRKDLFSNHVPITNKKLFVMENTNKGRFINVLVSTTVDVVNGWLYFDENTSTENKLSNLTSKTLSGLTESTKNIMKDYMAGKKRLFRKQIYGHRVPNSFRATISTKCGKDQDYDKIDIPWSIGMTAYTPIIMNFLVNRYGMRFREAERYIYRHINLYSDLLAEVFTTMEAEAPGGFLWVEMHRNPTLLPGSKGRCRATIKHDVSDKAVTVSMMIFNQYNADVDGLM